MTPDETATPLATPEVVLRFLESVGRRSDAEFYLGLFRADAKERFATLCVDGPVVRDAVDAVAVDLRFLASLSLCPVLVLGLFDAAHAAQHAVQLREALTRLEVRSRLVPADAGEAALREGVLQAARDGELPVVALQGDIGGERARFDILAALTVGLQTRKLVFLQRRGGLRQGGALVPLVSLSTGFDALSASVELSGKQRVILHEARRLVCERANHKMTVAITSPLDLLRELFTVKGAGTLLRRGASITCHTVARDIDAERLRDLLGSAFGKPVTHEFLAQPLLRAYVVDDYRGVAILQDSPLGPYLSKFAVEREGQGEGIGGDLWERLVRDAPVLFWRSRPGNSITAWYTRQCDSLVRLHDWTVFLKGFDTPRIPEAVAYAAAQPIDFSEADV